MQLYPLSVFFLCSVQVSELVATERGQCLLLKGLPHSCTLLLLHAGGQVPATTTVDLFGRLLEALDRGQSEDALRPHLYAALLSFMQYIQGRRPAQASPHILAALLKSGVVTRQQGSVSMQHAALAYTCSKQANFRHAVSAITVFISVIRQAQLSVRGHTRHNNYPKIALLVLTHPFRLAQRLYIQHQKRELLACPQ